MSVENGQDLQACQKDLISIKFFVDRQKEAVAAIMGFVFLKQQFVLFIYVAL